MPVNPLNDGFTEIPFNDGPVGEPISRIYIY
jgi:hypothetical protein